MPIELEKQYLKDRERVIRSIGEAIIKKTEKLFESDPSHPSLHNKPIVCSKTSSNTQYVSVVLATG